MIGTDPPGRAASAEKTIHVIQGEFGMADSPGTVLTTVLGSCISACLYDPIRRLGGMNHFLLPETEASNRDIRYAVAAMEQLLNALIKNGAEKSRLKAKLFGGARMISGLPDIGRRNGQCARLFLETERIPCVSESIGGTYARRVRFWPYDGRAQQLVLDNVTTDPIVARRAPLPSSGDVELF